ncbi:MAG: glycosyl transferase, partial [Firmicutes bacterium]|nr:glycosyl transferase [Bacillota bacterium]
EKKNVTFYSTRERIFRRNYGYKWCGVVHEVIPIEGKVLYRDDIAINHMTEHKDYKQSNQRNIAIYEKTIKQQKELDSRTIFYYARELHDGGRYIESVHYLNMFLDRDDGWVEDKINACMLLAKIYRDKFCDNSNAIRYALKTMSYSVLRVETCCFLGYLYKNNKDFLQAVDWFDLALHLPKKNEKGFVNMDYYEYIPNIELSVCFDKLGNRDLAKFYNEKAGVIKPYSTAYLHNKKYFDSI